MEESSEAHMETDVSSTTEDVPETQEVTDSDGNVEMVIVVETLSEDDTNSQNEMQQSLVDEDVNTESTSVNSSQNGNESHRSPTEDLINKNEDIKSTGILRSPQKVKASLQSNNGVQTSTELQTSVEIVEVQATGAADSSVIELPTVVEKPCKSAESSTHSQISITKPILITTNNLVNTSTKELHKTPTKELNVSPIKELGKTPTKDIFRTPVKDVVNTPPKELQLTPTKELVIISAKELEKSPSQEIHKSPNKELQKSPPKESQKSFTKDVKKVLPLEIQNPTPIEVKKTPTKESQRVSLKEFQKSPTKESQRISLKECQKTPIKVSQRISPKESQKTPPKDSQTTLKDLQTTPTNQSQGTPPKEFQKTLPKDLEKSPQKELLKTSSQELAKTPSQELKSHEVTMASKESSLKDIVLVNGKEDTSDKLNDSSNKNVNSAMPMDITNMEVDASNDSHHDANSDTSEKEHNKSISRELKSLIKSAKESKIISECNQLTTKTRKSRTPLETTSTNLNSSFDAEKIQLRRNSDNSQKSNCSEKSDKTAVKRSMRSQNPEFVTKVKQFLNSVTGKGLKESDDDDESLEEKVHKDKTVKNVPITAATPPKLKKTEPSDMMVADKSGKLRADPFCWRCHWAIEQAGNEKTHGPMACTVCPRSYHFKCLTSTEKSKIHNEKNWVCPECLLVLQAESSETRAQTMKKISLGMLCELLKHALERMMDLNGVEPFMQPVDRAAFPDYDKYVVHPMDLTLMKNNIAEGLYGSTEAFLGDALWILHNSIIFNTYYPCPTVQSKLTAGARALVRSCRAEMGEIEACAECYAAAHERRPTWFTDVCTTPHILLWAKLKGFPYWPAKGMSINNGLVDVRFFGAHDRAWVPAKDCFLYSEKDPNNFRTKRQDILDSMKEAEQHIRNISRKYGRFVYPPFKTQFDPTKLTEQLKMLIPTFEGEVRTPNKEKSSASPAFAKNKSRSNSKSSKSSINDGEMSENEETPTRKMADGAEIAREEDESTGDKSDVNMEVDTPQSTPQSKPKETKKRRRSELVEAVITVMESSNSAPSEKRRKVEDKKSEIQEPISSKEVEKDKLNTEKDKATKETKGKADKEKLEVNKVKDSEPSSSTEKEKRVTPIRIAFIGKGDKRNLRRASICKDTTAKIVTPSKDNDKTTPQRPKSARAERTPSDKTPKEDKTPKAEKSRNSRNRTLTTPKPDRKSDKPEPNTSKEKSKDKEQNTANKEKPKDKETDGANKDNSKVKETNSTKDKSKEITISKEKDPSIDKSKIDKPSQSPKPRRTDSPKSVKDRLQYEDNTTLAALARETSMHIITTVNCGMPTISSVRSLSTTALSTATTNTKTTSNNRTIEVTIEANSDSSIFTPTSTDNVTNMKDAVSKLQMLRNDAAEPVVGRVGVRAFARMTSPEKTTSKNDDVQVEVKAEPIDLDDADRQMEKLDLMNSFRLRPVNPIALVNPPTSNLREVRINKVLVAPIVGRKAATKPAEVRARAKKSFPQPKKPDDGSSGLNSKNSMVYIPIQPPVTGAPVRMTRPTAVSTANMSVPRLTTPVSTITTSANNSSLLNPISTPIMTVSSIPNPTTTSAATTSSIPTVGHVPTTVHTVPLMTSVNGQWMFSFQPVMSVGAIDNTGSPPIANGLTERATGASIVSLMPTNTSVTTVTAAVNRSQADTNNPGEPPRLQQRPSVFQLNPLDANTPVGNIPPPSSAGPVTARLNQNSVKLVDFFRSLLEDSLEKMDDPASQLTTLRLQLEQAHWRYQQQAEELKHNLELTIAEMRSSFEKEKLRVASEVRRQTQIELEAAVKLAKSKQWCANCSQEAQFYCCWNTSYCDYGCQRAHWSQHFSVCTQLRADGNGDPPSSPEHRLQPQPDNLPKGAGAGALTVGGKLLASRVFSPDHSGQQKTSLIMSMVEDTSGNKTMKCVGTYKSSQTAQQPISPVILNKQIMNNEENANKKMVSSGGYLIVGAANTNNSSLVMTPARRTQPIQQIT